MYTDEEINNLARKLADAQDSEGKQLFGGVWDDCHGSVGLQAGATHPETCECNGSGRTISLDLNRWLIAIGTGAAFDLLPNDTWICTIPQTTSQSLYQRTPFAALLEAVDHAVAGL